MNLDPLQAKIASYRLHGLPERAEEVEDYLTNLLDDLPLIDEVEHEHPDED